MRRILLLFASGLLAMAGPANAAEEQQKPLIYDPMRGLRDDGGIPPTDLPSVAHPERWRYVPPGRIPPGNMFQRFFVTSFIVPRISYEAATGVEVGIGVVDTDFRKQKRQEFISLAASRSTEGQEEYRITWERKLAHHELDNGGAYFEERSALRLITGYDKNLTARFFGLGADSQEGDETNYTDEATIIGAGLRHGIPHAGDELLAGIGFRYEHHNLSDGELDDVPSTDTAFPSLVAAGDSHDSWWISLDLQYDHRDSSHQPYRGWNLGVNVDIVAAQSDADAAMITTVNGSWSWPVPSFFHDGAEGDETNPPTDTIAIGGFVQATSGELPFYFLPSLGGADTLRGYIRDRFIDRYAWHLSAEWRSWPIPRGVAFTDAVRIERIGLALFVDLGSVAPHADELFSEDLKSSFGLGIRWAFERTAVFRTDYAISEEDSQFIADFGLSF